MKVRYDDATFMDAQEEFREKFLLLVENLESRLIALQNPEKYEETVNEIFQGFHSLKALAHYLNLLPAVHAFDVVETVLEALRHKHPPARQEVVDWLLMLGDHFTGWAEQMDRGTFDPDPVDAFTLNMVRMSPIAIDRNRNPLADRVLLLAEPNPKHRQVLEKHLKTAVRRVCTAATVEEMEAAAADEAPDMAVFSSDLGEEGLALLVDTLANHRTKTPITVLVGKQTPKPFLTAAGRLEVDALLCKSTEISQLKTKLDRLAEIYYDRKWLLLHDKEIGKTIARLGSLNKTAMELQKLVADPESTVRQVASVITDDPMAAASLLKTVNAPLFGLKNEITNVPHCVSLLGKEQVAAIILRSAMQDKLQPLTLAIYDLDENVFYSIAKRRMELMTYWYSKVSFKMLPVLTTTALLGNLGQIVLSKEAAKRGISGDFKKLCSRVSPTIAEAELFNTTAEDVTADLLEHWGLGGLLADSVRYSLDFSNAPEEVKAYAVANYVVYRTIRSDGQSIDEQDTTEMKAFLREMNADVQAYEKALDRISTTEVF